MLRMRAVMYTFTTYGTWLRGDRRGWVDDCEVFPPNPALEAADRKRMKHAPFLFSTDRLLDDGRMIGESLIERLSLHVYAMAVRTWHVHFVTSVPIVEHADVAKCGKDAVRWGLQPGRPIWTDGYDKRFCFDDRVALNRIHYLERHNSELELPAKPYDFIVDYETS